MAQAFHRASRFAGRVTLPGDKSISHRALMFASLAEGASHFRNLATGRDVESTAGCLRALGSWIETGPEGLTRVEGRGLEGLDRSDRPLDAGNSGTTMRLLAGILAGQAFESTIDGDVYLRRRPMRRVVEPLEAMGAQISTGPDFLPPLAIRGGNLTGISYRLPVASAQVKSCVLLAGLYARGKTEVLESVPSRDHTERMLPLFGAALERRELVTAVTGGQRLRPADFTIPGDPSSAAFFAAAAAMIEGGEVLLEGICLNPTRAAFFAVLEKMGARLELREERQEAGEPVADLLVRRGSLTAVTVEGAVVPSLIDEVPVLAVLATQARGVTRIRNAEELRVKETDRLKALAVNLRALGATVTELPDGLEIEGPANLTGTTIPSFGDHRIAMAFSVAGLVAEGETAIEDPGCAEISLPGFYPLLRELAGLD